MSKNYCPVEKVECYQKECNREAMSLFERCPWPHKHIPIKPDDASFLAGRVHQSKVDWEAVAAKLNRFRDVEMHEQIINYGIEKAMSAIESVAPKVEK